MTKNNQTDHSYSWGSKFADRHPILANLLIIIVIALLGIYAAYLATALFTKHGRSVRVPGVENISYTQAIEKLHDSGLNVDIRDSLYREDMRPGYVIEQFPKANSIVKPGRKIFLYINSVYPKQVVLDDDNHPNEYALKGMSHRSALAKFEELGFKNVRVVKVLGTNDRVVKVLANGKPVRKMQKIPVTASIVIEISDGRLQLLEDSLNNLEYLENYRENNSDYTYPDYPSADSYEQSGSSSSQETSEEEEESNSMYF